LECILLVIDVNDKGFHFSLLLVEVIFLSHVSF